MTTVKPCLSAAGRRAGGLLFLVFLAGCGLNEYEERMVQAQVRVKRFDDENKFLDEPLEMPLIKVIEKQGDMQVEKEVPLANLTLRPPKGISKTCEPKPLNGLMFRYVKPPPPPSPPGQPPTAATSPSDLCTEVYVGAVTDRKDFARDVFRCFGLKDDAVKLSRVEMPQPDLPEPLVFNSGSFEDGQGAYSVNIHLSGRTWVAVVYRVEKGSLVQAAKVIRLSLETFRLAS